MEKIKIILTLLILISLTGIATAETKTINYDYSEFNETLVTTTAKLGESTTTAINTFFISDIMQFSNLHSIIIGSKGTPTGNYSAKRYAETGFVAKIGGVQVGSGTYLWNNHLINGISQGSTVAIVFDNFNANAFTGPQSLILTLDDSDVLIYATSLGLTSEYPMTITPAGAYIAVGTKSIKYNKAFYNFVSPTKIAIYNKAEFHQQLTYETYPNNNDIRLDFYKNGIRNKVIVNGSNGLTYINSDNTDDIHQTINNNPYIDVTVFNPMKPSNQPWINRIPEIEGGITGKTKITYKLVDATQPYITLRGLYQIWEYHADTDTFTEYDIGNINGETDIYFDSGKTYSIEFTNNNYKPFKIDYNRKIELVSKNNVIEMEKDEGDNITVSFRAENKDYGKAENKYPYQYFRDFSITKNGETKYSNNAGYIFYENITPQEFNIIAKTAGYDDYHKNYGVLDKTQLITIPLKSEGNYKFLSLKAYNGNNPSQTVATNYKIYVTKNGIETLLIETEAMQGAFVYYLEVGFLHRVEYSSYGFKSGEIVYNPFFMDVVEKIYLYPEEEGINTLIFEIVDSKNIPSYGVRVAIGEEIKYTDTNGKTSFALPQGPVTYEIYKQGYQKIGNSFNLTEDYQLKITLLKDGEAPPSTTPEIPPTEVKPSNIIESVKYAFSKMFGFNYNNPEDITKNNLLFGLIIVLGVATVVASVTKDGLGALVGGAIGFVFSSALGLIPIWVLLTGFAFIAIYIILFRISNDGGN